MSANTPIHEESIREIGSIQDIGYLLAVKIIADGDTTKLQIVSCSSNIDVKFFSNITEIHDVLDKDVSNVFDPNTAAIVSNLLLRFEAKLSAHKDGLNIVKQFTKFNISETSTNVVVDNLAFTCTIVDCSNDGVLLLEFEEVALDGQSNSSYGQILKSGEILSRIRAAGDINTVTGTFLDAIMDIMKDFDRGMVYRFEPDCSGNVIHEIIRDPSVVSHSYLNLRFPESDIPNIMRKLYVKCGMRFIYDVHGQDSKIISKSFSERIDLSMSSFRSSHPCHLQYLSNMGVVASLSIPIVIDDRLWGIYAVHSHRKPSKPTIEQRIMLEMLASMSSFRINIFEVDAYNCIKNELATIMKFLQTFNNVSEFLSNHLDTLLQLLDCQFIGFIEGDHSLIGHLYDDMIMFGDTTIAPTRDGFVKLNELCTMNSIFKESSFKEGLNGMGGGVIMLKHPNVTLVIVRVCEIVDINWAGVNDTTEFGVLQPRKSFAIFTEKAKVTCKQWTDANVENAQYFFEQITLFVHSHMLTRFRTSLDQSNSDCVKAINEAKENYDFFAQMSHELRTPFHGVISSLQILQSSKNTLSLKDQKELVTSALDCGNVMLKTLDDILNIAKSKHCVEPSITDICISMITALSSRMLGPMAETKRVLLRYELCPVSEAVIDRFELVCSSEPGVYLWDTITVRTDETRVLQLVNNLTNNAIKFTKKNGVVSVRARLVLRSQLGELWQDVCNQHLINHVFVGSLDCYDESVNDLVYVIEVTDSGSGVTSTDMQKMANAYMQADSTSRLAKTKGTGLGLHICKLNVGVLNGIFSLASTIHRGSTFFAAIPVSYSNNSNTMFMTHSNSADSFNDLLRPTGQTSTDGDKDSLKFSSSGRSSPFDLSEIEPVSSTKLLFIVDDSKVNLKLAERKIKLEFSELFKIVLLDSGQSCIMAVRDLVESSLYHELVGVLMDYHMPEMDGSETIRNIRSIEATLNYKKRVPIAAFTADVTSDSEKDLKGAGADYILPKPTPADALEAMCRNFLKKGNF